MTFGDGDDLAGDPELDPDLPRTDDEHAHEHGLGADDVAKAGVGEQDLQERQD